MSAAQDVEEALAAIAAQVTGLRGVYVSDRDGIPILSHSSVQPSLRYCHHFFPFVPTHLYMRACKCI